MRNESTTATGMGARANAGAGSAEPAYTLRRMILPAHWATRLMSTVRGNLSESEVEQCDNLRASLAQDGWQIVDASTQTHRATPEVNDEETLCRTYTARRNEHPLLPSGKKNSLGEQLTTLRGCIVHAADGGSYGDVTDAAEDLLHSCGY